MEINQQRPDRLVQLRETLHIRGRGRTAHYGDIEEGLFTKPVKIGKGKVGWPEREVTAINAARIAGKSEDEIRELVRQLEAQRTAGA